MDVSPWVWAITVVVIVGMIVFDFVGHVRTRHAPTLRESAIWSAAYVGIAVVFGLLVAWHYGGEYERGPDSIRVKGDEKAQAEMLGLFDIGYRGYAGFELCHPLPVVNGQTVGLEFVDKNAQLAAEYMRGILAEAKKQQAARA